MQENFASVHAAMKNACQNGGRAFDSVTLVAASKTVTVPVLEQCIGAGHTIFGESRVQEAMGKWPALKEREQG